MGSEIHSQSSTSAVDRIRRQGKSSSATDQDNLIELSSLESSNSNFERSRNTVDYHGNREDDMISAENQSVSLATTQGLVFANPFLGTSDQEGEKSTSWSWDDPPSKHGNDEWLDTPGISHGENLDQSVRNCRQGSFAPHLEGMESIVRKIRRVSRDREIDTPSRSEKNGPLGHACDGPASSTQNSRSVTKEIRPSSLTCGDKDERGTNINLTEVTTSRSGISRILSTLQHSLKKTRSGQDASPKRPGLLRLDTGSSTYSQDDLEKAEKGDLSSRGCCKRQSRLICILLGGMIGIVIAIILVFYAWSVEVFWGGEMAPGKYHSGLSDALRNHTAMPVKRRWLHSHNDEMHGRDALALALKYGFGSIEADVWLGPVPKQSSPSSSAISSATAASSEVKRRTVEYVGSIHSSQDTIVHLPVNEKSGLVPRGAQPDPGLTLLIGHKTKDLTHRTLAATYLEPLMTILEANNRDRLANQSIIGLYKDDPSAEVQLVIDMKNDGDMTWPYLVEALQPLIDKGYLSTYNQTTSTWSKSAIMVIGTGNTPIHRVYYQNPRTIFYDAPLKKVSVPVDIPATDAGPAKTFEWDSTISPMASDKFPVIYHVALAMPPWNPIINNLRRYTFEAAKRGIASRWWGFARKPAWVRRRLWEIQKQGGVDWTNADDLKDAERWLTEYEAR